MGVQERRDGAVTVITIDVPTGHPVEHAVELARSLSDGVMLERLRAFARGDRPTAPNAR